MATVVTKSNVIELPGNRELPRVRWTRTQYHKLAENGFLDEGDKYELIEGEVIPKMPQGRRHALTIMLVLELLQQVYGTGRVQAQVPISLDANNEPGPDVAVLNAPSTQFVDDHPGPENILLLVEVSSSTLNFDRTAKAEVYARAGVPEYWILDVNARRLTVCRNPASDGYRSLVTLNDQEAVSPSSVPTTVVSVAVMLPPLTDEMPDEITGTR